MGGGDGGLEWLEKTRNRGGDRSHRSVEVEDRFGGEGLDKLVFEVRTRLIVSFDHPSLRSNCSANVE